MLTLPGPGFEPFSITQIPGKNAYLAADPGTGVDVFSISSTSGSSGGLKLVETSLTVPDQMAICWSSYSRQTGSYYVNDVLTGIVTEIAVNSQLQASVVNVSVTSKKGFLSSYSSLNSNTQYRI